MKSQKEKRYFYVFIILIITISFFSFAALCNMCALTPVYQDSDTIPGEVISALAKEDNSRTDAPESSTDNQQEISTQQEQELTSTEVSINLDTVSEDLEQDSTKEDNGDSFNEDKKIILRDNRIVLSIDSMSNRSTDWSYGNGNDPNFYETKEYFTKIGIPDNQLLFYWGQDNLGGTFDNFKLAVDTLKVSTDENCIVYIFLMGHGNTGNPETGLQAGMEFANGLGNEHGGAIKTYSEICRMLNAIKYGKMVIITHSCAGSESAEPLNQNTSYPRITMAPITIQEILNYILTDSYATDMDMDGRVSIMDIYTFVKDPQMTANPSRYEGVALVDPFNIASSIFLN